MPEFKSIGKTKMVMLCNNFYPFEAIKSHVLFREGEPSKYVYIVRKGEL